MNISLIYPLLSRRRSRIDENKQFWPPLGLAYMAAVLESKGHKVQIIDRDILLRRNEMDFDKTDLATVGLIEDFGAGLVGISATTPNMSDVNHVSAYIKGRYKDVPIVIGGPHPSGEPILSLRENPHVDLLIKGEGEFAICEIADGARLKEIKGLNYREGGAILSNPEREPIRDIDELPMPARHLLDMNFYTRPSRFTSRNLNLRTTSIFTARGCPYRCNFCAGPLVFSGKVRFHSAGRVLSEIEELISRYDVEALYFAEDMFLSSKKRAEEILGLFLEKGINRKIRWFAQAKASIVTSELLGLMKEAGCVGIEYGFESGSQRVLDLMNKNLKVEDSLKAAAIARDARLRFQANIIVGFPGEREEDFKQTIDFLKKIRPSMIGFNIFMPLPGTPSYEKLKNEGRPIPAWDDIGDPEAPHINYADMPKEAFERLYLETRLKVILPVNLKSFIADNINNPLRMLRIGLTQFKGVIIKTMRSVSKLNALKRHDEAPKKARVLFISYNGLLEPILPSQSVPYMRGLSKRGFDFTMLTYEKGRDLKRAGPKAVAEMKEALKADGIDWHYLRYHKNPPFLSTAFDILVGAAHSFCMIRKKGIKIVHVRGITPGMMAIALSKILKVRLLFDMRGLLAEEYVGGGLWEENGLRFRMVKAAEKKMLGMADAVTVLTRKHLELNRTLEELKGRDIPMDVVPCCVDMNRFYYDVEKEDSVRRGLGIKGKFVLMYPGKTGTFYLVKEMMEFYKALKASVPNTLFLIVTNDSPELVLRAAAGAGLSPDDIMIKESVRFEDMPAYVRIADAGIFLINPYKKIGSSPIKMGEFLASGVPVVINPGVGDTETIVADNNVGVVVKKFAGEGYKKAVNELSALLSDRAALKTRCRRTAERFLSLEDGINRYEAIYKKIS